MLAMIAAAALTLMAPRAVDGDTLAAGRERYRIEGIDAPEIGSSARWGGWRRPGRPI